MIVYRLCSEIYKEDLSGSGAALYGGRWNFQDQFMLYASCSISLCILEVLVHMKFANKNKFSLVNIQLPEQTNIKLINYKSLKNDWRVDENFTKEIGNDFLQQSNLLYMKVPSVIVPQEFNIIINPHHKDIKKLKIIESQNFVFDERFLV